MLARQGTALRFLCHYTEDGAGKTGLTVTVDVWRNGSEIVTGGSATELGDGLYTYELAAASNNAVGYYAAVFKTSSSDVDQQDLPGVWFVIAELATINTNLDAAISSRSTFDPASDTVTAGAVNDKTGYSLASAPPTAAAIADAVLDEALAGHAGAGSAGAALANLDAAISTRLADADYTAPDSAAAIAAAVWSETTRTLTAFGFNVTVDTVNDKTGYSVSATPPTDSEIATAVWGHVARTLTAFGFGVTVDTVNDKTGYSLSATPPTVTEIRQEMDANSTQLANLDATISSRSTFDPASDTVTAGAVNDKTGYSLASAPPTAAAIADAVLDEALAGHAGAGSAGEALANLDAAISSRSTFDAGSDTVTVDTNNDKTGYSLASAPPTAAAIADAVWDEALTGHAGAGSAGAALTSASSGSTPPTVEQIRTEMDANSTKLANLDAAISTRSSHAASDVTTHMDANSTKLANLDAAISTRLADADYTAPDSAAAIAAAVWSETTRT